MCHYCCYLTHMNASLSPNSHGTSQCIPQYLKCRRTGSCSLTVSLCLVSLTIFFVMLNTTLVLSHSSRIQQQQREQSSN
ncbi:unnamed protein product, partial [Rotaria magnacalcarata]